MSTALELLNKNKMPIFILLSLVFLFTLLRTAWISDDILITLRVVQNFIHGFGPRFNIDERVQVYTHPLWFLILSFMTFCTKSLFFTIFFVPICLSIIAFWLFLTKISKNLSYIIIAACALILSKAYVDFSTSGLENPLSHLLIILSVIFASKANSKENSSYLTCFFLCNSCIYLSRPDLLVLMCPLILYVIIKNRNTPRILIKSLLIGIIPTLAWTLFSLYYYGFLFPNTAYAKLGTGISVGARIIQGFRYLFGSIVVDPLTFVVIGLGIIIGIYSSTLEKCLSIGILIYLIYIVVIGGDFMAGRFLTEGFLLALIVFSRSKISISKYKFVIAGVFILGAINIQSTLLSGSNYKNHTINKKSGLADERGYYFDTLGLVNLPRENLLNTERKTSNQHSIQLRCGGLGERAFRDAYNIHYFDTCALIDPLLSHLSAKPKHYWRPGHFVREVPENYQKSIDNNKNLLINPELHAYYDVIREITRGNLNSIDRFKKIIQINLGVIKPPKLDENQKNSEKA